MDDKRLLRTRKDVCDHFGAECLESDSDTTFNRAISNAVYEMTSCGASARFERMNAYSRIEEKWKCHYVKRGQAWYVDAYELNDEKTVEAPQDVIDYFWPEIDNLQETLSNLLGEATSATLENDFYRLKVEGVETALIVSSIVEGTDAETTPLFVYLPCLPEAIERALKETEEEARHIWLQTHGCDECARRLGEQGPVDPECPECEGEGVIL